MKTKSVEKERKKPGTEMVRISLGVALLMPWAELAHAQFAVNCTRSLLFETVAVCGAGGKLSVQPDGDVVTTGCVIPLGTPRQALCSMASFTTNGSLQIKVTAKTTGVTGPGAMQVKGFNIKTDGGGPTLTLTSATLTATPVKVGIGADLVAAGGGQANGSYNGQLMLQVVFTP